MRLRVIKLLNLRPRTSSMKYFIENAKLSTLPLSVRSKIDVRMLSINRMRVTERMASMMSSRAVRSRLKGPVTCLEIGISSSRKVQ